jgi:integral membrane sensor domain MASE1
MSDRPTDVKRSYQARRRRQAVIAGLSVLCLVTMLVFIGRGEQRSPWFLGAGLATVLLAVLAFRNWRCPACGRYLGRKPGLAVCPGCGVALE